MKKYQLFHEGLWGVRRTADRAIIPAAEGNADWQEYLEWLEQGNEPEPAGEDR